MSKSRASIKINGRETGDPAPENSPAGTPEPALSAAGGPAPNVKFVGRGHWNRGKTKYSPAPAPIESFIDGGDVVNLPAAELQLSRRLFYHNDAGRIVRLFPHKYKRIIRRGSETK